LIDGVPSLKVILEKNSIAEEDKKLFSEVRDFEIKIKDLDLEEKFKFYE